MKHISTNWSKKELLAYILVYCMEADFKEKSTESDYIRLTVGDEMYDRIHKEISGDNDFTRISKIQSSLKDLNLDSKEKGEITTLIAEVFAVDDKFSDVEQGVSVFLGRILKS